MYNIDVLNKPIDGINLEAFSAYLNRNIGKKSLSGEWKFVYLKEMDDKYLEANFNIGSLNNITIPSHIEFNDYDIPQYVNMMYPWDGKEDLKIGETPKNNPIGIYFKDIEINNLEKDHYLEFEGFESALFLYVNGTFVGYSTHNFTNSTFKLNTYLKQGKNRLTIVVFKYSFASWYTDQDMFRLSGINRPINLISLDPIHFIDIHNKSILKDDYITGLLDLDIKINKYDEGSTYVDIELYDKDELVVDERIYVEEESINLKRELNKVKVWSDEDPNLYKLVVKLVDANSIKDEVELDIGFRNIQIKEGVMYLNNKRLVIRGVNRHEFNCNSGRVSDKELIEEDIKFMKSININALRTSHYPNSHYLYELCDKYGIIVMDEVAIETHGTWANLTGSDVENIVIPGSNVLYKDFTLARGKSMYERDKNYTCILFLSLGNESHAGTNLEALSNYFKDVDKTRIIHYEGCFHNLKYSHISDVTSRMYEKVNNIRKYLKKNKDKPFVLCEFSHAMGNSLGNFDEYMDLLDEFNNYQGGFIWDFVDQGILKDGEMKYGGDFREYPHDNNFCANGIVLADRRPTSKVNAVKYHYSNIQFDIYKNKVSVINKNNFIDTSNLYFKYYVLENGVVVYEEEFNLNVAPLNKKDYKFKFNMNFSDNKDYVIAVGAYLKEDTLYALKDYEVNYDYKFVKGALNKSNYSIDESKTTEFKVFTSLNHITVENKDFMVVFRGVKVNNGGLEAIIYKDKMYLDKVALPTLFRPTTDNDAAVEKYFNGFYLNSSMYPLYNPYKNEIKVKSIDNKKVVIEVVYTMIVGLFFSKCKINYTVYASNEVKVEMVYKKPLIAPAPPAIGMRYKFYKENNDFSYIGLGKEETYIDKYKGVKYGAFESKASEEFVDYSIPQECANHEYTKEVNIPIHNNTLSFTALNNTFAFKYLPYNEFEIELAERKRNLPSSDYNYLTLYAINKGVGGDDSWGARVHKKYLVKNKKYRLTYAIKIKE